MKIKFEVPGRPLSWNKYYAGQHWAKRKAMSDEWKWVVKAALTKWRVPRKPITAPVRIIFFVYVKRAIDCDNIVLKTYIDGMREWGFLPDDTPKWVAQITIAVKTGFEEEKVDVEVSSVE
jgi:Holliday junction resolvase RusA-like endonuclease